MNNFVPLRHPNGEIKRGHLYVPLKDVTIIYYSHDGKSSFKPFKSQRSNCFKVFAEGIHSLAVGGISFNMDVSHSEIATVRIDYAEYETGTMPNDVIFEVEVEQAKMNGTWVE